MEQAYVLRLYDTDLLSDVYKRQDTESYIWFLQNNVIRTTGLEFPLPEGDVEQQARFIFDRLSKIGALTILEG